MKDQISQLKAANQPVEAMMAKVELAKAADVATVEPLEPAPKVVMATNPGTAPVLAWYPTSVSFPRGEMAAANLNNIGPAGRPAFGSPLKTWDDGSVAIAQYKIPYYLQPGEIAVETLVNRPAVPLGFQFNEELGNFIASGLLPYGLRVQCNSGGQVLMAYPFTGEWKLLRSDSVSLAFRYRGRFYTGVPLNPHPLSFTLYAEAELLSPIIKMTLVIGNDTLESPVAGGIEVSNWSLTCVKPMRIQNEQAYGSKSCVLADGQQIVIRSFICASNDQIWIDTMNVMAQHELIGLQQYEQHQASRGLMTHQPMMNPRFPASQILTVKSQVDASVAPLVGETKTWFGTINMNPPSTGDQPDFGAGHPFTKAMQSYSLKLLNRHWLGVLREGMHPSHFWETRNGKQEWCSLIDYPTLFFWSSRPHWHPSWNPEYPVWQARGQLDMGPTDGWGTQDNQHMQNNGLRAMYELSGEYYLRDLCHSTCSILFWNFHTKWANATEAERGARTMKESYAMASLFRDTPEGARLMEAFNLKCGVFDAHAEGNRSQYGMPVVGPFNSCDGRVNGGVWCAPYPGNTIAVAWQTGFHMELLSIRSNPPLSYLDAAHTYFLPDGTPKTYFPMPAPNDYTTGGIGLSWWAGWIMLAEKHPEHPNSAFILSAVKAKVDQAINPVSGYFSDSDRWKAWA